MIYISVKNLLNEGKKESEIKIKIYWKKEKKRRSQNFKKWSLEYSNKSKSISENV